ncbi:MAG: hypothetical protein NTZ73_03530 [Candidatus Diapherotrites archaeon]|nr:hypothetical protein [Candidatus Diapherotrites archaeon]
MKVNRNLKRKKAPFDMRSSREVPLGRKKMSINDHVTQVAGARRAANEARSKFLLARGRKDQKITEELGKEANKKKRALLRARISLRKANEARWG